MDLTWTQIHAHHEGETTCAVKRREKQSMAEIPICVCVRVCVCVCVHICVCIYDYVNIHLNTQSNMHAYIHQTTDELRQIAIDAEYSREFIPLPYIKKFGHDGLGEKCMLQCARKLMHVRFCLCVFVFVHV